MILILTKFMYLKDVIFHENQFPYNNNITIMFHCQVYQPMIMQKLKTLVILQLLILIFYLLFILMLFLLLILWFDLKRLELFIMMHYMMILYIQLLTFNMLPLMFLQVKVPKQKHMIACNDFITTTNINNSGGRKPILQVEGLPLKLIAETYSGSPQNSHGRFRRWDLQQLSQRQSLHRHEKLFFF